MKQRQVRLALAIRTLVMCAPYLVAQLAGGIALMTQATPDSVYPTPTSRGPPRNPGIVSIPAGFPLGWPGSLLSPPQEESVYEDFEVRALIGADQRDPAERREAPVRQRHAGAVNHR